MFQERTHNGGNTTQCVDLVLLDKSQCIGGIPLVLSNDAHAIVCIGIHSTQASDVKERECRQRDGLWLGCRRRSCASHSRTYRNTKQTVPHVRDVVTVCSGSTFGKTCCSRRVQDGGNVVGINTHVTNYWLFISGYLFPECPSFTYFTSCYDGNVYSELLQYFITQTILTFTINNYSTSTRICECIFQLVSHPPRIQADKHGTDALCCPVGDDPFGIVTHSHCNTITLLNTLRL